MSDHGTYAMYLVAAIRAEALVEAREAVAAAMTKGGGYHSASEFSAVVLAAIDALRGES